MSRVRVDVHVDADHVADELRADARRGLTSTPKDLPPKWFYDERGSELFGKITRVPEYYPTRTERGILASWSPQIAQLAQADTLVELGSGTSAKTRLLLDAMADTDLLRRFVPFDVSEQTLRQAARTIAKEYKRLDVHAVAGDFDHHLDKIPAEGTRVIAFLGGTIGNFEPLRRGEFLAAIARTLKPGDSFLLGTDLVKDVRRLEAAYDDAAGVTAKFNRNVLKVLNRELDADFVPKSFDHVAQWRPEHEWIEMRLRARGEQVVKVPALDLVVEFADGEEMRTEISAKFRREGIEAELRAAGLDLVHWWTDPAGDFALSLSQPHQ